MSTSSTPSVDIRIWQNDATSVEELVELRSQRDLTISLCIPALNEDPTIGDICSACLELVEADLIQQLVVVDSGSTDDTRNVARAVGADVFDARELLHEHAPEPLGKGGALWKSLAVAEGDIVVWVDSDTRNFGEHFVTNLVEPLLVDEELRMTKAFYDRPFVSGDQMLRAGGARVTELAFRPLATMLFPELTGFVQPLSGEYAGYRTDLMELGFFSGYGVETGLLIDFVLKHSADAVAQVDLGARLHHNQDVAALGKMAFEVIQVMMLRAQQLGRIELNRASPAELRQFTGTENGVTSRTHRIEVRELPPMRSVLSATRGAD